MGAEMSAKTGPLRKKGGKKIGKTNPIFFNDFKGRPKIQWRFFAHFRDGSAAPANAKRRMSFVMNALKSGPFPSHESSMACI